MDIIEKANVVQNKKEEFKGSKKEEFNGRKIRIQETIFNEPKKRRRIINEL